MSPSRAPNPHASAAELAAAVRAGRATADGAFDLALAAALAAERDALNALVARHLSARAAFAGAEQGGAAAAARRRAARSSGGGPLAGVPFLVADDLADLALPTTCGSRVLAGYVSPYEATAVARLLDAGGVLFAKTNVDEFGVGRDTATSVHGATRHPGDATRTPGGASGGLAAAIAAGVARLGLGIDVAGDTRLPAAYCGVVALKPTYGRVSRVGAVARANSLAQIAAVGRCVDDAALALELAGGRDPLDATSADVTASVRAGGGPVEDGRPLRGVRVGRARDALAQADPAIAAAVEAVLVSMRDLGAEVRDVTYGEAALVAPAHRAVAAVETASALARFDGVRFGPRADAAGVRALVERTRGERLGSAVLQQLVLGLHLTEAPEEFFQPAQAARARASQSLVDLFRTVDLIVAPTARTVAPRADADVVPPAGAPDHADALLLGANLAGLPAASVPVGTADGLPIGAHFVGQHFGEPLLVRAAAALERLARAEGRA